MRGSSERMKKWGIALVIIFLIPAFIFFIYSLIPQRRVEKKYVLRDLETVKKLLLQAYVEKLPESKVEVGINSIAEALPKKFHRMDFYLKLQPFLSNFNDPDTRLIFGVPEYFPVLPFKARFVGERLFVIESVESRLKDRTEILEINGMKASELYEFLRRLVSSDTTALAEKRMVKILYWLPFIKRREKFSLVIEGQKKLTVSAIPLKIYVRERRKIYGRERVFGYREERNVGILRIRTFDMYGQDIQDFEDLLEEIGNKALDALIIDLRDCEGGDFRTVSKIMGHLIDKEVTYSFLVRKRHSKFTGSEENRFEDEEKKYEFSPIKPLFNFPVVILVDRTTSREALFFAYMAKSYAKIVGEKPQEGLSHTVFPTGKWLPSVSMYVMVSTGKLEIDNELSLDCSFSVSDEERLKQLLGKEDVLLERVLKILLKK